MTPTTEMISVRNGMFDVELRSAGKGEPLVYLHGGGGPVWDEWLETLAQDFSVYAPTHPGWGASTGLEQIDDVVDMALYYHDLLDALGLQSVNLVGSSLGGMFAAEIAALNGSYVRRLVLCDAVGLWRDDVPVTDIFVEAPDELERRTFFDPAVAAARRPVIDPNDRQAVARANIERQKALSAAAKFIWPIPDKGLKKRIHRIKAPTLLVWGEADGLVPPIYGEEFQTRISGSQLVVMPRAGHLPMLEQRDEFVRIVREFLVS